MRPAFLALAAGLLAVLPAAGFTLPRLASPAEVSALVREMELPPTRPGEKLPPLDQLPYAAAALKGYDDPVTAEEVRKNRGRHPLKAEVLDAFDTVREVWTTPPPAAPPKKKDGPPPPNPTLFVSTLRSPVGEPDKKRVLESQLFPARAIPKLELVLARLEAVAPLRAKQSKKWQAHYDYALAETQSRLAFIHEYDLLLGHVRTDNLPPLDAKAGHNGWRIVPSEKLVSKREVRELAEAARKLFADVAANHKGTPWAAAALRETAAPIGLKWEPTVLK